MTMATQDGLAAIREAATGRVEAAIEASRNLSPEKARFVVANAMLDTYGEEALGLSASILDHYAEVGPSEFAEVWCMVTAALYDLQNAASRSPATMRH